ncbi:GTP pyrophosphokinase [Rhodococcoides kyotonense]|uniref:PpGpp synthetase catalytic domain-containing protein (RelA/SpoT-type nucleotidyltranferase) n=1 Tax=Rhodococcoides kyotonense TaxID=398843 RepID=A0A239MXD8_9NOCA|nr:hypothetical protein [Rhodococcus kyotonensis]SNT46529.1 ppGpp synthetase catalytic domain-containing protein (RelA/SpoT-type nucleotidyltranferase) [Rhodococcus kyotonensis]
MSDPNGGAADQATRRKQYGAQFDDGVQALRRLGGEVQFALESALIVEKIKTHSVTHRVKDKASFLDKIERKAYEDPFGQTPDLVGARVVCLFKEDLERIDSIVRSTFEVLEHEDKLQTAETDQFGYMSVHYVCELSAKDSGARYNGIKGLKFEIQCRTLLMDAWANVSHYLAYKGEASIPDEILRDFHALSALFYVADNQLQNIYNQSRNSENEEAVSVESSGSPTSDKIDRSSLKAVLRHLYPDREASTDIEYSEFVEELATFSYNSVEQFLEAQDQGYKGAIESERYNPPSDEHDLSDNSFTRYTDIGFAREALGMVDQEYAEIRRRLWMRQQPDDFFAGLAGDDDGPHDPDS